MSRQLHIRELIEEKEEGLSPYACKSRLTKGRVRYEDPHSIRTEFQRDRDRIIHCKSFRRLKHKTQVFIAPSGDHYRTRLTHTLEVSQIARTLARALNLNEDLTEAISLGHDLGHTPFGHIGEEVLNELSPLGFRHNEQSLRVVELLENDGRGLNLTWEVRDGILHHSKSTLKILADNWGKGNTLEAEIVKIADLVAYINHDIDDSLRAGVLKEEDLPPEAIKVLGQTHSRRIDTMVMDIILHSWKASGRIEVKPDEVISIGMSKKVRDAAGIMRDFLFEKVYNVQAAGEESEKARNILRNLYNYFITHTNEIPANIIHGTDNNRWVLDYIAGMTDQFAEIIALNLSLLDG